MNNQGHNQIYSYLKETSLFGDLNDETLVNIANSSYFVTYKKNDLIIQRGDLAEALFVIVEGSVQIYKLDSNQQETVITRLKKGDIFGEQGYVANLIRPANAIALSDVELIKIEYTILDSILKNSGKLRHYLDELSKDQAIDDFTIEFQTHNKYFLHLIENPRFMHVYVYKIKSRIRRALNYFFLKLANLVTLNKFFYADTFVKNYAKDEVIFNKGDSFNYAYLLLAGEIVLSFSKGVEDLVIKEGTLFGELSLLEKKPRAATAWCKTKCILIAIGSKDFLRLLETSPDLYNLTSTINRYYKLPKTKTVAFQMIGTFLDQDAVFTRYTLKNGNHAECIKVISQPLFKIHINTPTIDKTLTYKKGAFLFREIKLFDNRIVGLTSYGAWSEINVLCEMLLKEIKINPYYLSSFEETGELLSASLNEIQKSNSLSPSNIICPCMHVPKQTVEALIAEGNATLMSIATKTGATTICGGCIPAINELLGQTSTIYAIIEFNKQYTDDVISLIIKPTYQNTLPDILAGQFAHIYVEIDSNWIERSYSLAPATSEGNYEIFVKKHPGGIFSNWLFDNKDHSILIKMSQPIGKFLLRETQKTVLCFASGIGITPFIAFIREIQNKNLPTRLKIIYIVKEASQAIIPDDVAEYIASNDSIDLKIWNKAKEGLLTKEDVNNIVQAVDPEFIYICGQLVFQNNLTLLQHLSDLKFPASNILFEVFTPS